MSHNQAELGRSTRVDKVRENNQSNFPAEAINHWTIMIFSRCSRAFRATSSMNVSRRQFWSKMGIKNNGTLEMVVGGGIVLFVALDKFLVHQQSRELDALRDEIRTKSIAPRQFKEQEEWHKMPSLFVCTVRKKAMNLDGFKCLTGVEVGDEVEVLQEKVGPGEMYNLCRKLDENGQIMSIGWFPTQFLEKL